MGSEITRRVERLEAAAAVLTDAEIHAALVQYGDDVFAAGPDAPDSDPEFDALLDRFTVAHAAPDAPAPTDGRHLDRPSFVACPWGSEGSRA